MDKIVEGCSEDFQFSQKNDTSDGFRRNTAEVIRSSVGRGGDGTGYCHFGSSRIQNE